MCTGMTSYHQPDGWISVKDRLPDTDMKVIVYDTLLGVATGYYEKVFNKEVHRWILNSAVTSNYEPKVTHWRELPDPPRMKERIE